jgi:hypothetical protein
MRNVTLPRDVKVSFFGWYLCGIMNKIPFGVDEPTQAILLAITIKKKWIQFYAGFMAISEKCAVKCLFVYQIVSSTDDISHSYLRRHDIIISFHDNALLVAATL